MTEPIFLSVSPRLRVADLDRSIAFYRDILGFAVGDPWPVDMPQFVIVERGAVRIQLSLASDGIVDRGTSMAIEVSDALAVYDAVKDRVTLDWGPEVYWYGRREFSFRDPDGHSIIISAVTPDAPTSPDE